MTADRAGEQTVRTTFEMETWLIARVGELTGIPLAEIDAHAPLLRYGLDSVSTVRLISDIETWLGCRFTSNPLEEHPTIASLAVFLAGHAAQDK